MNLVLNELKKDEKGKTYIQYYNLEKKTSYRLKFGKWNKVPPMHSEEIKLRFDPIYVAALILTEIEHYTNQMKIYSEKVVKDSCTTEDKNEYTRIIKTLHYLNNYTL